MVGRWAQAAVSGIDLADGVGFRGRGQSRVGKPGREWRGGRPDQCAIFDPLAGGGHGLCITQHAARLAALAEVRRAEQPLHGEDE